MPKSEKLTASQVAEVLSNFVNSATLIDREEFVKTLMRQHRTLQQEVFTLFMSSCQEWAKMFEQTNYDPRNEFAVVTSKKIVEMINRG